MKILLKNTIQFYLSAKTGRNIHKPFVENFISSVMDTSKSYRAFLPIEEQREAYIRSTESIEFVDYGAGNNSGTKKLERIAHTSLSRKRQCRMLFQMINEYGSEHIIELGTSLGITTLYLAAANTKASVKTLEGNPDTVQLVRRVFRRFPYNIEVVEGNFNDTFAATLANMERVDFVFIDGNHAYEPTIRYFNEVLPYCHEGTILVFDDIYWSEGMFQAWNDIKDHPSITVALDLHFMGVVFFKKEVAHKIDEKLMTEKMKPWKW